MLAGLPPAKGLDVLTLSIALALALLSGLFKLGFIANLLDRPVVTGFITAAFVPIGIGQLKHILEVPLRGHNLPELVQSLWQYANEVDLFPGVVGITSIVFLWWARVPLTQILYRFMSESSAKVTSAIADLKQDQQSLET